jgi:hypothetical protein
MAAKKIRLNEGDQHKAFKDAARNLDCDESEESFDRALGKIGKAKIAAEPKPPAKKRKPTKIALKGA